jgi:hypothetical protein
LSTNTIVTKAPTNLILSADVNQYFNALVGDVVPRNTSGVPTNLGGSLGQIGLQWNNIYFGGNIIKGGDVLDLSSIQKLNHQIQTGKQNLDGFPNFLEVVASTLNVKILAGGSNPNLDLIINGATASLTSDITITGLIAAPAANNTCSVNDVTYTGQTFTKSQGEFHRTFITIDTIGSEISSLDGTIQIFKHGSGPEYFLAYVDTTNNRLWSFKRGIAGSAREALSNNDTITLLKGNYIFLDKDLLSHEEPIKFPISQPFDPVSPATGDIYFDTSVLRWKRYNGSVFEAKDIHWLGIAITDDTETVAVHSNDFDLAWGRENDIKINWVDADTVRIFTRRLNVAGNSFQFEHNFGREIKLSTDLESGFSEAADTLYYIYADKDLNYFFSPRIPRAIDKKLGYYHPLKYWRWTGCANWNDSSSDLQSFVFLDKRFYYEGGPTDGFVEQITLSNTTTFLNYDIMPLPIATALLRWSASVPANGIFFRAIGGFPGSARKVYDSETVSSPIHKLSNGTALAAKGASGGTATASVFGYVLEE